MSVFSEETILAWLIYGIYCKCLTDKKLKLFAHTFLHVYIHTHALYRQVIDASIKTVTRNAVRTFTFYICVHADSDDSLKVRLNIAESRDIRCWLSSSKIFLGAFMPLLIGQLTDRLGN